GVRIGAQTYSFRDLPRPAGASDSVDVVIAALTEAGLTECELFAPQLEPQFPAGARGARGAPRSPEAAEARQNLRKWRLEWPLERHRPERIRDARELRRGDEDVEILQGQPRRRSFLHRRPGSGRLHPRASRGHHEPASEGSKEAPGRQHAVGGGRYAPSRSAP